VLDSITKLKKEKKVKKAQNLKAEEQS